MIILGVNTYHADVSAAILVNGKLIAASLEERFTRTKHWAGFPQQATGRVVLTSNCSSMPDVAGAGALLVDPLSVSSIRNGIEELCKNAELRANLIAEGFKNTQRFLPAEIAQKYLALYRRLVPEDNK